MAEKSGFFNAKETEDGIYDREYDAEQFAGYFANFISNGVYANPTNQLKVVFDGSPSKPFSVIVRKGKAYIDGYWYELTEDMEITIPANMKSYAIKDVVCCTLDKTERKVSIVLKEDVVSDIPVNNNTQHDLVLSTLLVQPNASKLNAEDITDKRPDKTYCGFVTGMIDQIDTTELFQQYDDAFQIWFNEMKDQLTEDAAGNLQTQIGLLSNLKTAVKDSIVNAINWLYDNVVHKTSVIDNLDDIIANQSDGKVAGAKGVSELNTNLENIWSEIYPVGSIYMSVNSTNPNVLFGGTWTRIKDCFLLGAGSTYSAGRTGGEAKHKLTTNEMPSHTHPAGSSDANPYFYSFSKEHSTETAGAIAGTGGKIPYVEEPGTISDTTIIRAAGGGVAHNNMPPYLTVYIWKRTA